MALLQAGIAFDAYEIVLRDKPTEMLALSPKATVPVLLLSDGTVIEQSLDIMRWAFEANEVQHWWARALTAENQALIALNDGAFKQHLDRYKYPEKFGITDPTAHRAEAMIGLIQQLDQRLAAHTFLGGTEPCAADVAIFPFVRQFRAVDERWFDAQTIHATQRWLARWMDSDLFATCMKKLPSNAQIPF